MGPFSWDMDNLLSNILYFVKKWCLFIECHIANICDTKTRKKIIKVDSKSLNLSPDSWKNIDFLGSYKQSQIAYKNGKKFVFILTD